MPSAAPLPPAIQAAIDEIHTAIMDYDPDRARRAAETAVARGVDPLLLLNQAIAGSAAEVGEKFDAGEFYLPQLVLAGDALMAVTEVLEAAMPKSRRTVKKVIVIGTVEGDLHTIGKNTVSMMLRAGGFQVHDLGCDVKSAQFIAKAKETNADVIALSSLLTTTMPYMREVVDDLKAAGLRDRFKILVGGGPVTRAFADSIAADGYGVDAMEGLRVARTLAGLAEAE